MRFVQPAAVVLGAVMYVGVITLFLPRVSGPSDLLWILAIVGAWNLVMLVATVVALIDGVLRIRAGRTRQLAVDAMIVKLASIPFFLINFAVLTVLFNSGVVLIFLGPEIWTVVAIGSGLTYLTMLSTSIPVWATLVRLRRERTISTRLTVLYAILSFLFVTDIATGVLLFGRSRRRPRLALMWLLLGTGMAMVAVGVLDYFYRFLEVIVPILGFFGLLWAYWGIPIVIGIGVLLATVIVSVLRRSDLRLEAWRASAAEEITTDVETRDQALAG